MPPVLRAPVLPLRLHEAVDGLTISLDRSESQQELLKLAATLTNTTADRLFFVAADKGTFVTAVDGLVSKGPSIFRKALVLISPGAKTLDANK